MITGTLHQLRRTQSLRLEIGKAWEFFSNPGNLSLITPPNMQFRVISEVPEKIYAGLIIQYRLKPLGPMPLAWVTEITQVQEPCYFVDEQRFGPYRFWHHQHHLRPIDGGTKVTDIVHYKLHAGIAGNIVHKLMVRRQLETVFRFREKILRETFGELPEMKR